MNIARPAYPRAASYSLTPGRTGKTLDSAVELLGRSAPLEADVRAVDGARYLLSPLEAARVRNLAGRISHRPLPRCESRRLVSFPNHSLNLFDLFHASSLIAGLSQISSFFHHFAGMCGVSRAFLHARNFLLVRRNCFD